MCVLQVCNLDYRYKSPLVMYLIVKIKDSDENYLQDKGNIEHLFAIKNISFS